MRKRNELAQSSDIAFLLIIFFLLLSGVATSDSLQVDLPKSSVVIGEAEELIQFTLLQDGTLTFQNRTLSYSELSHFLNLKPHLTLSIEPKTDWQAVVSLLSVIEQYPLSSLKMEVLP